jgi:hypothetical protein
MVLDHLRADSASDTTEGLSLDDVLLRAAESMVGWSLGHPAYTQLLFWRPVPGFTPSAEAYAPAIALVELSLDRFTDLQRRGLVREDADIDDVARDWTVLLAGVVSQQMSNAPDEPLDRGRFTAALPTLVAMFARHYGNATHTRSSNHTEQPKPTRRSTPTRKPTPTKKETRRGRNR